MLSFSCVNKGSKGSIFSHELYKGPRDFQISCRNRAFSTGWEGHISLLVSLNSFPCCRSLFPHVSSKHNQIEILLDIVHDLGFQEGLSLIVHNLSQVERIRKMPNTKLRRDKEVARMTD